MESLNKRITYLKGLEIITLTEYAKQTSESSNTLLNAARRQTRVVVRFTIAIITSFYKIDSGAHWSLFCL